MRAARRLNEKYKQQEDVEETTCARTQEEKDSWQTYSSIRGMRDLEPEVGR